MIDMIKTKIINNNSANHTNQKNQINHSSDNNENDRQGWEIKKLGDLCDLMTGGTPSTK